MNEKKKLIIFGAGGHARAVLDVIAAEGRYDVIGLIDDTCNTRSTVLGLPVFCSETEISALYEAQQPVALFVAIGDNYQRAAVTEHIRERIPTIEFATCVHPSAIIGRNVDIGQGSIAMPGVIVIGGSKIGEGCILNTGSSLDHDGIMNDYTSLAPGVVTGGQLRLGKCSSIGLGARVIHNVSIGNDSVIGAGALVLDDVPDRVVAYGSPCQVVRQRSHDESYL